jgi:hypothetical protein
MMGVLGRGPIPGLPGGGGFAAGGSRKTPIRQAEQSKEVKDLLSEIESDRSISDITRRELLASLQAPETRSEIDIENFNFQNPGVVQSKDLGKIRKRLNEARGGGGVFGQRQRRQTAVNLLEDQPGQRQTILTGGARRGGGSSGSSILTGG